MTEFVSKLSRSEIIARRVTRRAAQQVARAEQAILGTEMPVRKEGAELRRPGPDRRAALAAALAAGNVAV